MNKMTPDKLRLFQNLPGMVYRCRNDQNWTMEYVSEGCSALLGFPPEKLLLSQIYYADLVHRDDLANLQDAIDKALATHSIFDMEYRVVLPDSRTKWVWERGQGVYDAHHQVSFLEGYITDITERHLAEAKARQEATFRELIHHLSLKFINLPFQDIDRAINDALRDIGQYFKTDRTYLFRYDFLHSTAHNTHEWCAPGVSTQINNLQNLPFSEISELLPLHCNNSPVLIPEVSALGDGTLKLHLEEQSIQSLVQCLCIMVRNVSALSAWMRCTRSKHMNMNK